MPYREQNSNKGSFGKIINFAGSDDYIGAAYLSTISALKIGAGLIALASVDNVIDSVSKLLPESIYLSREDGIKSLNKYSVLMLGCGLGTEDKTKKDFMAILDELNYTSNVPLVIDADGLNLLAQLKDSVKLSQNLIITPHPMEAARLLDCELVEVLENPETSAIKLSALFNCVTVLKMHRTILCEGDKIFVNQHGNSALAKAGSGDVLAGMIAGLLAQKMDLFEAAKLGVYLHSRCGELASEELTEYSVLASDLVKYLPQAIKEIL